MGETQLHLDLVRRLVEYAEWRLRGYVAVAVFADLPSTPRRDKPQRVGGFVPDVYASDVPTTFSLVGEAKTIEDLETRHTILQLGAFFRHVTVCGGALAVAVPWTAITTARRVVHEVAVAEGCATVEYTIIDEMSPWH